MTAGAELEQDPTSGDDEDALAAFERRMATPILVAALLPIAFTLAGRRSIVAGLVLLAAWVVFLVDLVVHVRLRKGYLRSTWGRFDLILVLLTAPWFLVADLHQARFFVVVRLARLARVARAGSKKMTRLFEQLGTVIVTTVLLIFTCAYIAYGAERHGHNPLFHNFEDAIWWATVTLTTVGYGDIYPKTPVGRIAGVILMAAGLAVLGVLAGALASFFGLDKETAKPRRVRAAGAADGGTDPGPAVAEELAALRAHVHALAAALERSADGEGSEPELDDPEVVAEVRACFDDYEDALAVHDVERLDRWFLDDPTTTRFGIAEEQYGAEAVAAWRRLGPGVHPDRRIGPVVVTTVGADVAVVACEFRNGDAPELGRQSQTWVRTAEGWRVLHAHVSVRPEPDGDGHPS